MQVRELNQITPEIRANLVTEEKKSNFEPERGFQRQMNNIGKAEYEKYILELTDKISRQGEIVAKKVDIKELQKYKEYVTELLHETAANAYTFHKSDRFDVRGRRKTLSVIKKVNQKLDEMTSEVLSEQTDNIKLLQMLGDVRGMLVDLFL